MFVNFFLLEPVYLRLDPKNIHFHNKEIFQRKFNMKYFFLGSRERYSSISPGYCLLHRIFKNKIHQTQYYIYVLRMHKSSSVSDFQTKNCNILFFFIKNKLKCTPISELWTFS